MKNMGLKNFDNSNKINLHTFAVCAYGESPYLEECVQSLLAQKVRTRILIATSTPNSYIYGIGEKYGIPVHINHGEKGLAGDWNFAYSCATIIKRLQRTRKRNGRKYLGKEKSNNPKQSHEL